MIAINPVSWYLCPIQNFLKHRKKNKKKKKHFYFMVKCTSYFQTSKAATKMNITISKTEKNTLFVNGLSYLLSS